MPTHGLSFWLSTSKFLTFALTICLVIVSVYPSGNLTS